MLTLSLSSIPPVSVDPVEFSFTTNLPSTVYYTLDGKSPMCPTAILWDGTPVRIDSDTSRDVTIRAVAYDDVYISNQLSQIISMISANSDADGDLISNLQEGAPYVDTDVDGTPDYLDSDSDNDGKTDLYEGTADYNSNGIPNFQDPLQHPNLMYEFTGWPITDPLVENVPYLIKLKILNGSGLLDITEENDFLVGIDPTDDPILVSEGDELYFTIMPTPCRFSNTETLRFVLTDDFDDNVTGVGSDITIVSESEQYPLKGIQITWKKNNLAKSYRIYRKSSSDAEMRFMIEVPHDPAPHILYQWYIDREGDIYTRYSVAAVDDDKIEGVMSLPKHAPDINSSTCLIQGNIADVDMTPVEKVTIACKVKTNPSIFGNTIIYKGSMLVYTDVRGYFELVVPQGALIVLTIDEVGFKKSLIVPHVSSINLKEILAMPQNVIGG